MRGNKINNQDISVDVEVTGSIAEALNKLGKKVTKDVMLRAAKAGATVVAASINERIPVDTGELKGNLAIEVETKKQAVIATVGFLDEFMASVAYWVEHGHNNRVAKTKLQRFFKARHGDTIGHVPAHPFFRPGIDAALKPAFEAVMAVIDEAINGNSAEQSKGEEAA